MDSENELGRLIVKFREKKGMNQKEFSEKINISQPVLSRWENGSRQPAYHNIEAICRCFDISVKEFLSGEMKPYYRIKRRLMINRIIIAILIVAILSILAFLMIPRYRMLDKPEYVSTDFGSTLLIKVYPVFRYADDTAAEYSKKLADKYRKTAEADAIQIDVFKSAKDTDDPDDLHMSSVYLLNVVTDYE